MSEQIDDDQALIPAPQQASQEPHAPLSPVERESAAKDDPIAWLFDDESHWERRCVGSFALLKDLLQLVRDSGYRIVLTSGSFDILHWGHSAYLEAARAEGDFLVVGVDSDEKIFQRKKRKPLVPEDERLRSLTYQRGVGLVVLKKTSHTKRWRLIDVVRPDVLVVTRETYSDAEHAELERRFKLEVKVMPRMATISTTARLRDAQKLEQEPLFQFDDGTSPHPDGTGS